MSTPTATGRTFTQRIVSSQLTLFAVLIGATAVLSLYILLSMGNSGNEVAVSQGQASNQVRANTAPNQDVLSDEWLKQYHSANGTATRALVPNDVLSEEWLKNRAGAASVADSRSPASQLMPDNYLCIDEYCVLW